MGYCQNCGRDSLEEQPVLCPFCGLDLGEPVEIDLNTLGWLCTNHHKVQIKVLKEKIWTKNIVLELVTYVASPVVVMFVGIVGKREKDVPFQELILLEKTDDKKKKGVQSYDYK